MQLTFRDEGVDNALVIWNFDQVFIAPDYTIDGRPQPTLYARRAGVTSLVAYFDPSLADEDSGGYWIVPAGFHRLWEENGLKHTPSDGLDLDGESGFAEWAVY